jgi:hypothetical protein
MLRRSQFFGLFIVWSSYAVVSALPSAVGVIYNASFTMLYFGTTMNASSCYECLCAMFSPSMNTSMLSLNCIDENSSGVICQLLNQTFTLNSNNSQIKINRRSTFYFQLLQMGDQSESTSVPRLTSTSVTTQQGACFISHKKRSFQIRYFRLRRRPLFDEFKLPRLVRCPTFSIRRY